MDAKTVSDIYNYLAGHGVKIWIDGGWCVDALLEKQTREHPDLDVALDHKDEDTFIGLTSSLGYAKRSDDNDTDWNFVLNDDQGHSIDVHIFEYDDSGKNIYGIEYPYGSLAGKGKINGQIVGCVAPEWMFKFKTAYTPKQKDIADVHALSEQFGFEVPATHQ